MRHRARFGVSDSVSDNGAWCEACCVTARSVVPDSGMAGKNDQSLDELAHCKQKQPET